MLGSEMPDQAWTAKDCSGKQLTDWAVNKLPRLFSCQCSDGRCAARFAQERAVWRGTGLTERSLNYSDNLLGVDMNAKAMYGRSSVGAARKCNARD
jgi:hypothetical protein